uniref:G_PROTEIN_RECEP_F1_2 domain-containing protein n=1 Tax=Rhabditophanes sp. KR3021 TaxID=114890 RepID=A0AC35TZV5_9BILA
MSHIQNHPLRHFSANQHHLSEKLFLPPISTNFPEPESYEDTDKGYFKESEHFDLLQTQNQTNGGLNSDDIFAGLFLIIFGILGIALYTVVCITMARMCKEIVGFRFLLSQAFTDILLLLQFGIFPGVVILTQNEIIPSRFRWHFHIYLDFTWWAMVYHYAIVAWSRLAAVQFPNWFRTLSFNKCILICSSAWILGLLQSIIEHQMPWFEFLYYDPTKFGLTADWQKYSDNGTALYYMIFNWSSMIVPFPFYGIALYVLLARQRKQLDTVNYKFRGSSNSNTSTLIIQRQLSIETRLLIPCIINTLLFVVGQIGISICSNSSGKWISWAVMVIFATNSFVNPVLYLCFSSVIRRHIFTIKSRLANTSSNYKDFEFRSSSQASISYQQHQQRTSLIKWKKDSTSCSN